MEKEIEDVFLNEDCIDIITQDDLDNVDLDFSMKRVEEETFQKVFSEIINNEFSTPRVLEELFS